jgi:ABC-2 type transport system permease protein
MTVISNPKQFIRVTFRNIQLFLSTELTYRNQIIAWVVADTFQPFVLAILWINVVRNGSNNLSVEQMVTYFFLVAIVSKFTKDFSDQYVSNRIIHGEFAKYLVRPFNYLAETLGISIASKMLRLVIIIPFLLVVFFFFSDMIVINLSALNLVLFTLAMLLGFVLSFLLGNIFALIAFFIKEILGIRAFYENTVTFLSGEVIPLMVMPLWAVTFVKVLPFRYTLSFPIEIVTGQLQKFEIVNGFFLAFFWLIITAISYKLLYRTALKKYEAEGI